MNKRVLNEIDDDQIRVIGTSSKSSPRKVVWAVVAAVIVVAAVVAALLLSKERPSEEAESVAAIEEVGLFEQEAVDVEREEQYRFIGEQVDSLAQGYCEVRDTIVAEHPLRLFIPHNATMSLHVGRVDKEDDSIIYTAQAADIRRDNGRILGAFVMAGEELAWGLTKKGFCASIDGKVTVGVSDNSPLFDEAVAKGGHFFRQYPLVKDGVVVENNPENVAIRRAICDRYGEIFMVESLEKLSFHDFSIALVTLGVEQGIYLVGSDAYGWAVDKKGNRHEFGVANYYTGRRRMPRNTSYIIWRRE